MYNSDIYRITVFTPTFNRAYIISNLYESLKRQTFSDFEWIIVDDGSTDNTEELINKFKEDKNVFNIKYLKTDNGGKHRAINKAVEIAQGELFFIVDSDDYLVDNALEKIIEWEYTIKDKSNFAGIAGCKGYSLTSKVGQSFNEEYIDATSLERSKYNIIGDKAEVFYTKVLMKYKFPEFEKEKFITENIVWNRIAFDGYKIRWFNDIIYICDYLEDGLTKAGQSLFINNPQGYALSIKQEIFFKNLKFKKKIQLWFDYYIQLNNRLTMSQMANNLEINKITLFLIIMCWRIKRILIRRIEK